MIKLALFAAVAVAYYIPQLGEARDVSKEMLRREAEGDEDEVLEVLNEDEMKADTTVSRDEDGDEDEISLRETSGTSFLGQRGENMKALVIVDVQASFLKNIEFSGKDGSLAIPKSKYLPDKIIDLIRWDKKNKFFDFYILTQDWHSTKHIANASAHKDKEAIKDKATVYCRLKEKKFETLGVTAEDLESCCSPTWNHNKGNQCRKCTVQEKEQGTCKEISFPLWPNHCITDPKEEEKDRVTDERPDIPVGLLEEIQSAEKEKERLEEMIIRIRMGDKEDRESFSMFADTGTNLLNGTDVILRKKGINELYFTGLATDFCVGRSALHALGSDAYKALARTKHGKHTIKIDPYKVTMFTDLMEGLKPGSTKEMLRAIQIAGGEFMESSIFMDLLGRVGRVGREAQRKAQQEAQQKYLDDLKNDLKKPLEYLEYLDALKKYMEEEMKVD